VGETIAFALVHVVSDEKTDVVVIGGGLVGLSTAAYFCGACNDWCPKSLNRISFQVVPVFEHRQWTGEGALSMISESKNHWVRSMF